RRPGRVPRPGPLPADRRGPHRGGHVRVRRGRRAARRRPRRRHRPLPRGRARRPAARRRARRRPLPYAARRVARAHPRMAAVRADVWQRLPLATGAAAVVLSVFGPRNAPEIARVLHPQGRLVVVSPAPDHLRELVGPLGMLDVAPDKEERLARQLAAFTPLTEEPVRYEVALTHDDVVHEVRMGPSAHHVTPDRLAAAVARLPDPVRVTVAVTVTTYRPPAAGQRPVGVGSG